MNYCSTYPEASSLIQGPPSLHGYAMKAERKEKKTRDGNKLLLVFYNYRSNQSVSLEVSGWALEKEVKWLDLSPMKKLEFAN